MSKKMSKLDEILSYALLGAIFVGSAIGSGWFFTKYIFTKEIEQVIIEKKLPFQKKNIETYMFSNKDHFYCGDVKHEGDKDLFQPSDKVKLKLGLSNSQQKVEFFNTDTNKVEEHNLDCRVILNYELLERRNKK